jgi:uncharacterized protein (DUF1778 family)
MEAVGSVGIDGLKIFLLELRVVSKDLLFRNARSKPPEDFFNRNSVTAYTGLPPSLTNLNRDARMCRCCCHWPMLFQYPSCGSNQSFGVGHCWNNVRPSCVKNMDARLRVHDLYGKMPYTGKHMAKKRTQARLAARLPSDVYALLKRAAALEGRSLTDFVISAAREAATRTIEQSEIVRLSEQDQRMIAEALLNPPIPSPSLKRAFQRHRELISGT